MSPTSTIPLGPPSGTMPPPVTPGPAVVPPCEKLPVSSIDLTKLAELRAKIAYPPTVTFDSDPIKKEVTAKVQLPDHQDLFYAKTIFELQTTLHQLQSYRVQDQVSLGREDLKTERVNLQNRRKDFDRNIERSSGLSDTTDPLNTNSNTPLSISIREGSGPSAGIPLGVKSPEVSMVITEKPPEHMIFSGKFAREKTKEDYPVDGNLDGIAKAFACLLQMFYIMLSNYPMISQRLQIRSLHKQIQDEMKQLQSLDLKSPVPAGQPSRYNTAIANLSPEVQGYIQDTNRSGKLNKAREAFYKPHEDSVSSNKSISVSAQPKGLSQETISALCTKSQAYRAFQEPNAQILKEYKTEVAGLKKETASLNKEESLFTKNPQEFPRTYLVEEASENRSRLTRT